MRDLAIARPRWLEPRQIERAQEANRMDHCPGTAADYANAAAQDAKRDVAALERRLAAAEERSEARKTASQQPGANYAEIEHNFSFHPATTPERQAQHEAVRDACKKLAHALDRIVPPGRHSAMARSAVEEAMHWANAGIACYTPKPSPAGLQPPAVVYDPELFELVPDREQSTTLHVMRRHTESTHLVLGSGCACQPRLEPRGNGLLVLHN